MVLWINGFMRGMELAVNMSKRKISTDMTVDISAVLPAADENITVYFFEKLIPSFFLSATSNVLQPEEVVDLECKVKNEQGGLATNTTVHFFEKLLYDYINKGDVLDLQRDSGVNLTSEDGALKITTSTNGEKRCYYPLALTDNDNYTFECTIAKIGVYQSIAMYIKNGTTATGCWFSYENSTGKFGGGCTGSNFSGVDVGAIAVGDKITIKRENGVMYILHNDTTIFTKRVNFGGTYYIGHYTNKDREQYVKNIKIIKK